jgi:hypothetical protein
MPPDWTLPLLPTVEVGSPLPSRPADATAAEGFPTGSEFMAQIMNKTGPEREALILAELEKGNIPDFLREFKVIEVPFTAADGTTHNMMVSVMPDYLAIGSNDDHVLIPMTPKTAQAFADKFGYSLPTATLVDHIYEKAEVKITSDLSSTDPTENLTRNYSGSGKGDQQASTAAYAEHDEAIRARFESEAAGKDGCEGGVRGSGENVLTAGHKKDLVMTHASRFDKGEAGTGELAFYGWYDSKGKPIEGVAVDPSKPQGPKLGGMAATTHSPDFVDYSHGARMVDDTVFIDGNPMSMKEVLADKNYHTALSKEGVMKDPASWGKDHQAYR